MPTTPKRKTAADLLIENAQFRVRHAYVNRSGRTVDGVPPGGVTPSCDWRYYQTEKGMRSPQTALVGWARNGIIVNIEVERRDPVTGAWTPDPGYSW